MSPLDPLRLHLKNALLDTSKARAALTMAGQNLEGVQYHVAAAMTGSTRPQVPAILGLLSQSGAALQGILSQLDGVDQQVNELIAGL